MEGFEQKEIYFLIVIGIGIMLALGLSLVYFYYRASNKILQQELKSQEVLLEKTILTQERERKRIAKDLHDDVGNKLNVIHLMAEDIKHRSNSNPEMLSSIKDMSAVVNAAIGTTRRIAHDLLPPVLEQFGLEHALNELIEHYNNSNQIVIKLKVLTTQFPISNQMNELNLFRIIQELISNSVKHGKAAEISIGLQTHQNNLEISYKDDGQGFDASNSNKMNEGLGMKNIESRLKILKGKWEYSSSEGNGFDTILTIPI